MPLLSGRDRAAPAIDDEVYCYRIILEGHTAGPVGLGHLAVRGRIAGQVLNRELVGPAIDVACRMVLVVVRRAGMISIHRGGVVGAAQFSPWNVLAIQQGFPARASAHRKPVAVRVPHGLPFSGLCGSNCKGDIQRRGRNRVAVGCLAVVVGPGMMRIGRVAGAVGVPMV